MPLSFSSQARLLTLLGGLGILAVACGSNKTASTAADVLVGNDFESLAGWLGVTPNPSLTDEKAHSGHYSIKVDGTIEYSLGFASTLGALHDTRVKRIKVTAWVFVPDAQAVALLVTHAGDAPNVKPLLWDGFDVTKAVAGSYGKWVEVSKVMELPGAVTAATNIGFYLWHTGGSQPVYLDDLTVTAEPEK